MDDGGEDVRQLARTRSAFHVSAEQGDGGMAGMRASDDGRRDPPLLGAAGSGVSGASRTANGDCGVRHRASRYAAFPEHSAAGCRRKIGRASCRERVEVSMGGVSGLKKSEEGADG